MSDTKWELWRDQWIQEHEEMCGTCEFCHRYRLIPAYLCTNKDCEHYNDFVELEDGCPLYISAYR